MTDLLSDPGTINFGDLPDEVNALLQQGVAAYRHDHALADRLFCQALAAAPEQLPVYFCLYKFILMTGTSIRRAAPLRKASEWRRAKLAGAPIGAIGRRNPSFRTGPAASRFIR